MMKGTHYRSGLQRKMAETLAARDRIGDRAFDEGREPTREEWARMGELQARHDGYVELVCKFFPRIYPEDDAAAAIERACFKMC